MKRLIYYAAQLLVGLAIYFVMYCIIGLFLMAFLHILGR